jgi:dihydroxyacetone kinase-like protein
VALESCTNPNYGVPIFQLAEDEVELGVGIHGEPGRRRGPMAQCRELVWGMLKPIIKDLAPTAGTPVFLLVNGLGGTPLGELYGLMHEAKRQLRRQGIEVQRSLVGSFVTSLDMAGASLTLLVLDRELTALWDAPVHTAAFRWRM